MSAEAAEIGGGIRSRLARFGVRLALGITLGFALLGSGEARAEWCTQAVVLSGDDYAVNEVWAALARHNISAMPYGCTAIEVIVHHWGDSLSYQIGIFEPKHAENAEEVAQQIDSWLHDTTPRPKTSDLLDPRAAHFALEADAELTEVNGCCIFIGTAFGARAALLYARPSLRLGGGTRIFAGGSAYAVDIFGLAEYAFRLGRFSFTPSAAIGAEFFAANGSAFGVMLEPGLEAGFQITPLFAVRLRLSFAATPMNSNVNGPLSYTRLSLGIEWDPSY